MKTIIIICIYTLLSITQIRSLKLHNTNSDYISKSQLRYLFELLHQEKISSLLPKETKILINDIYNNNDEFNMIKEQHIINNVKSKKKESESFIDENGTVSRRGILHLIDNNNRNNKLVYAVSNKKGLSLYESQSMNVLYKHYYISNIIVKDIMITPCFLIGLNDLLCTSSMEEKTVWLNNLRAHIK